MHLPLLFTTPAFCRSYAAADPMTVKNPLQTLTEENADALSQSASMDGYTAVYSPMFQLANTIDHYPSKNIEKTNKT